MIQRHRIHPRANARGFLLVFCERVGFRLVTAVMLYWSRVRSLAASAMPAFAEQDGQAFNSPCSSVKTRAKRSETCDPQWSQFDIISPAFIAAGIYEI
jgi:hypothetical protein